MNATAINKALNTLAANAEFNCSVWDKYHATRHAASRNVQSRLQTFWRCRACRAIAVINGYTVCAYFVPAKGRKGSTHWQLSDHGGRVARANLLKILEGAA